MAAYQAPLSLRLSRQDYWSGLPFPSPMHESEKWKWSHSIMSNSSRPHGLQPTRLLHPWDFAGKSTKWVAIAFSACSAYKLNKQGDSIEPWRTPFPIWNQSVVPRPVLTVASWPAYRFLKRQVRWSSIPIYVTSHNFSYYVKVLYVTIVTKLLCQLHCNNI